MGWLGEPRTLTVCAVCAAKGGAGRSRRLDAAVGPWGARLPCAARSRGPRRGTRSAHFVRSAQTPAPSQKWMRVSTRAGHETSAARRRICAPRPARTALCRTARCSLWRTSTAVAGEAGVGIWHRMAARPSIGDARRALVCRRTKAGHGKAAGGSPAGRICGAEQRRALGPRAYSRASTSSSARVSEWHERSECNEFRAGAKSLSSAGESGPQGPTAASKPRRAPTRRLARATRRTPPLGGRGVHGLARRHAR